MNPGSIFKLSFCAFTCLSNNSLVSQWSSAKLVSALLQCMLYLSYKHLNVFVKGFTLQANGCHNLDPLHMICISFRCTIYIDVSHSALKVHRLEFFKIKLQSIYSCNICLQKGIKKWPIRSNITNRHVQPIALKSAEAKKLLHQSYFQLLCHLATCFVQKLL